MFPIVDDDGSGFGTEGDSGRNILIVIEADGSGLWKLASSTFFAVALVCDPGGARWRSAPIGAHFFMEVG